MEIKKTILFVSVATIIGATIPAAQSAVITANWDGLYTLTHDDGSQYFKNTSYPYYDDPTWGYGIRTQISGNLTYDTTSGLGTASISGFDWGAAGIWQIHDLTLQAVGDGSGSPGNLIKGSFLFDWNGNTDVAGTIIWDASGFLNTGPYTVGQIITNTGATPASDGRFPSYQIGSSPFATTTIDSVFPLSDDGIDGSAFLSGPWPNFNPNIDITTMTIESVSAIPIPAAVWLFGSGLLALTAVARRKPNSNS